MEEPGLEEGKNNGELTSALAALLLCSCAVDSTSEDGATNNGEDGTGGWPSPCCESFGELIVMKRLVKDRFVYTALFLWLLMLILVMLFLWLLWVSKKNSVDVWKNASN